MVHKVVRLILPLLFACFSILPCARAASTTIVYSFPGPPGALFPSELLYKNGVFFGTTYEGGIAGGGTVFKFDPSSNTMTVLCNFGGTAQALGDPAPGLVAVGEFLYGAAKEGGAYNHGAIFKVNVSSGALSTVYDFGLGDHPPVEPGIVPVYVSGALYGVSLGGGSENYGTVYKYSFKERTLTTVFSLGFDPGPGYGGSRLIYDNGYLYLTTVYGGSKNLGTIFRINLDSGEEETLYNFVSKSPDALYPGGGLILQGNIFYGTAEAAAGEGGSVFTFDSVTGAEELLDVFPKAEGASPEFGLTFAGGNLFGVAIQGGAGTSCNGGCGTMFKVNASSGKLTVLHNFVGGLDGGFPDSRLVHVGDSYYGTTEIGGGATYCGSGCGTIFKFTP